MVVLYSILVFKALDGCSISYAVLKVLHGRSMVHVCALKAFEGCSISLPHPQGQ